MSTTRFLQYLAMIVTLLLAMLTASASAAASDTASDYPFAVRVEGPAAGGPAPKAVILIPGLSSTGEVWDETVERLRGEYECHVLSLPGFGGRPALPPGTPFLETVRDGVLRYVGERSLERPAVVGHSLGGFLAFWLAAASPESFGAVVAVDGVPFLPALMNPNATVDSTRPGAEQMRAALAGASPDAFQAQTRRTLATMIRSPEDLERVARIAGRSDPAAVAQAMFELMTNDLRPLVGEIEVPVLLFGAGDFARTEEMRRAVTAAYEAQIATVTEGRFVMAREARHFVMLDDLDFFLETVRPFLAEALGGDGAAAAALGMPRKAVPLDGTAPTGGNP